MTAPSEPTSTTRDDGCVEQVLCPVVVGRDREISTLAELVDGAAQQRGAAAFLVGEAGVGKSRLAHVAREAADERGCRVLWGRAVAAGTPVPYRPLAEALHSALRDGGPPDTPELRPFRSALGHLVPEWGVDGGRGPERHAGDDLVHGRAAVGGLRPADGADALAERRRVVPRRRPHPHGRRPAAVRLAHDARPLRRPHRVLLGGGLVRLGSRQPGGRGGRRRPGRVDRGLRHQPDEQPVAPVARPPQVRPARRRGAGARAQCHRLGPRPGAARRDDRRGVPAGAGGSPPRGATAARPGRPRRHRGQPGAAARGARVVEQLCRARRSRVKSGSVFALARSASERS
ncbi:MAG: ATP-binding protein [Acidimicrobiia bacterium]